ncbi:cytochrome c peroxidase [Pseudobacteriovorax antillogorgiicola]|uniref:Cytochrome c peroxidase n=1 Tax=Pseudobacteriovorax antillogorgiicola TaxID=1513793 RepID=A0A1Y6BNC4_9BACT|nr:cytochrome c peroxidase [Pseudobacteriovorax antillogorgiicola]TCS55432.1 cytochrome c peroxidase [Pseudobacteriovorax antillogorgiicola]SMF12507.1 Cytochrome c peroxidase [Pseudobacteriovorax antillogorgiicola]
MTRIAALLVISITSIEVLANHSCKLIPSFPSRTPVPFSCEDLPQAEQLSCQRGQSRFFDSKISPKGVKSCASCHQASLGFRGEAPPGTPKIPSLLDIGRRAGPFFWNGRASTLASAIFWPLYHPNEIDGNPDHFKLFGGSTQLVQDLSRYLSTLNTADAPWDAYQHGDCTSLDSRSIQGFFEISEAGCLSCHNPPEFSGGLHKIFYRNLPNDLFQESEPRYLVDLDLHQKAKPIVSLWSVAPSLRNLSFEGQSFGRFGQHYQLESFIHYHLWQVSAKGATNVPDIVFFLMNSLQSRPELGKAGHQRSLWLDVEHVFQNIPSQRIITFSKTRHMIR